MPRTATCTAEGCDGPVRARGLCSTHYSRWLRGTVGHGTRHGEPLALIRAGVEALGPDDPCPPWPYATSRGYAMVRADGAMRIAAHIVLEMTGRGSRPDGMECCHSCGRGAEGCWHPFHLRWGTTADNAADRVAHGTQPRGERHSQAKLTEAAVREVRSSPESAVALARHLGVSAGAIDAIRQGRTWKHVEV